MTAEITELAPYRQELESLRQEIAELKAAHTSDGAKRRLPDRRSIHGCDTIQGTARLVESGMVR